MIRRTPLALACAATVMATVSCQDSNSHSSLNYAHATAVKMLGSPNGRLEIMKSGIKHTLGDNVNICVQAYGKNNFTNEMLLLETKLAHAMWLKAAGYEAAEYSKLTFTLAEKCQTKDNRWSSSVVLAETAKEGPGDDYARLFAETSMSCGPQDANSYGCQSDKGITLGWGGAGSVSYSYFQTNPAKWTSIQASSSSSAILSPFVDWQSLSDGVDSSEKLSASSRMAIKNQYASLLATQNVGYDQLVALGETLARQGAVIGGDSRFQEIMQQSASTDSVFTAKTYRPRMAAFHTLLHEIGHTFGIKHADNPGVDDITGQSGSTTWDATRGQHITRISAMAYADPYAYLTDDDRLGIKAAAEAVRAELANRR